MDSPEQIKIRDDQEVIMRKFDGFQHGVNLGGWLSQCDATTEEHFDTFITDADIKWIHGMGLDHVRLPVDYNWIEDEAGQPIEAGMKHIDDCVDWCEAVGLNVLLDLHKAFGYTFDPMDKDADREIFFHDAALQARFIALWRRLAARYGARPGVAFDLLNEVVSPAVADAWNDIAERTVAAIRTIAPDTWIVVGGVDYNDVRSVPLLAPPHDERIVYNFHCYEPMVFTHQQAYWVEGMPSDLHVAYPDSLERYLALSEQLSFDLAGAIAGHRVRALGPQFFEALFTPAIEAAQRNNAPLYCGEYGVIDRAPTADTLRWLKDISAVFNRHGIGRALWNYKRKDFGLIDAHYDAIRDSMIGMM